MTTNDVTRQAADQHLIDGLTKHATLIGTLTIGGQKLSPADLVKVLQGRVDAMKSVAAARGPFRAAVEAKREQLTSTRDLVASAKQALQLMFGKQIDVLSDFGLAPRKRATRKPEANVAAAAKAKATREARGTKGKKARLKIHGAVATTSPPSPAAPPPVPANPPAKP